jgi:hypothetical protein
MPSHNPTVQHYYQSWKFISPEMWRFIRLASTPERAGTRTGRILMELRGVEIKGATYERCRVGQAPFGAVPP